MKTRKLSNVLDGWASIFDLSGSISKSLPDYEKGPARDAAALRGDWIKTGSDIRRGMDLLTQS
jgi:hypothetical protein